MSGVCLLKAATRIIAGAEPKLAHAILETHRRQAKLSLMSSVLQLWDDALAEDIEQHAVELARGAGRILAGHFGKKIKVEFKDEHERDPVTAADKETQEYLTAEILKRFPEHGILGEEGTKEEKESEEPAKDILWVLDPLDGTTNFMNGLPVFASSIGVLYRGWPMAAALYLPWPTNDGGFVLHCHKGGGCFAGAGPQPVDWCTRLLRSRPGIHR